MTVRSPRASSSGSRSDEGRRRVGARPAAARCSYGASSVASIVAPDLPVVCVVAGRQHVAHGDNRGGARRPGWTGEQLKMIRVEKPDRSLTGEGPRQARPSEIRDPHAEVPAPKALPRRPSRTIPSRSTVGPRDIEAHFAFLRHVASCSGERQHVNGHALTPAKPGSLQRQHARGSPPTARCPNQRPRGGPTWSTFESHGTQSRGRRLHFLGPRPAANRCTVSIDVREAMSEHPRRLTRVIDEPTQRLDKGARALSSRRSSRA